MDDNSFLLQQFITLRDEIKTIKARLFWIVAMGLFGVPLITYLAESLGQTGLLMPMIPYVVLVVIVMFIAEQTALMRAGQYIRCNIEPKVTDALQWESWLEKRESVRMLDKHFFAVFVLVFFVYYFMAIGSAVRSLMAETAEDASRQMWMIAAVVTYSIGGIWALSTLLHHWRSATGTSAEE
ncbi:MAG: hypothetical protein GY842_11940 [bacterium]|nr:hypothetical protein [bacterium]